jgi:hypothetical protein
MPQFQTHSSSLDGASCACALQASFHVSARLFKKC